MALPAARPQYRKRRVARTPESSGRGKVGSASADAPAMLVPSLAHSLSVKETIQEVKMVQVCFFQCPYNAISF